MKSWQSRIRHPFWRTKTPHVALEDGSSAFPPSLERLHNWANRLAWPLLTCISAEITYCLWFECDYPQGPLAMLFSGVFLVITVVALLCALQWWVGPTGDPEFKGGVMDEN